MIKSVMVEKGEYYLLRKQKRNIEKDIIDRKRLAVFFV